MKFGITVCQQQQPLTGWVLMPCDLASVSQPELQVVEHPPKALEFELMKSILEAQTGSRALYEAPGLPEFVNHQGTAVVHAQSLQRVISGRGAAGITAGAGSRCQQGKFLVPPLEGPVLVIPTFFVSGWSTGKLNMILASLLGTVQRYRSAKRSLSVTDRVKTVN